MKLGDPVPDLAGTLADGSSLQLASLRGHFVVVYFYPKDNTPGCTLEAQEFRDLHATFRRRGVTVIGVSRDTAKSHVGFTAKHDLPFPLVADTDETWCRAFDVIHEKTLYGKKHLGVVRSTFLIDPAGKLAAAWTSVKAAGHAATVLATLPAATKAKA